ncbi:MAG: SGNH/GDSL hydrolase family protein [Pseudonocardiaceae bacterium]
MALGDSYAAGPRIPEQRTDPIGCGHSTRNYPALVAEALGIRDFTDVSCSGARTDNMTAPQQGPLGGGTNPPQFDALASDTDLVTVTISGNDIGFSDIFDTCFRLSATDPAGNPCQRQATAGGIDRYAQRVRRGAEGRRGPGRHPAALAESDRAAGGLSADPAAHGRVLPGLPDRPR